MLCPRCLSSQIPNDLTPGLYPGAISRLDNKTEICSNCGTDEALQFLINQKISNFSDWPVVNDLFKQLGSDSTI
jgi:hypothetical protein